MGIRRRHQELLPAARGVDALVSRTETTSERGLHGRRAAWDLSGSGFFCSAGSSIASSGFSIATSCSRRQLRICRWGYYEFEHPELRPAPEAADLDDEGEPAL
jgi:hypothetical protein